MKTFHLAVLLSVCLSVVGCGQEHGETMPHEIQVAVDGKEDITQTTLFKGWLGYEPERSWKENSFTEEFDRPHRYRIRVWKGGAVDLKVTRSSAYLHLVVYGPSPDSGKYTRVPGGTTQGVDPVIEDLLFTEEGSYLVLVAPVNPFIATDYRLELGCANDACMVDDAVYDSCDGDVDLAIRECVDQMVEEDEGYTPLQGLEFCLDVMAEDIYTNMCDSTWGSFRTSWCFGAEARFLDGVRTVCRMALLPDFQPLPEPTVELQFAELPQALEEELEGADGYCEYTEDCMVSGLGYSYALPQGGRVPLSDLLLAVQHTLESPDQWWNQGSVIESGAQDHFTQFQMPAFITKARTEFSGPVEFGEITRNWYPWANVEAWESVLLLNFFESGNLVVVSMMNHET